MRSLPLRHVSTAVTLGVVLVLFGAACSSEDTAGGAGADAATTTAAGADGEDQKEQTGVGDWGADATAMRGKVGERAQFECSAKGTPGSVWGTNVYTDDSSVCTAAVQVGLIDLTDGGTVTIEIAEGSDEYFGTTVNGVESASYGAWPGSFIFPDAETVEVTTEIAWDRAANFYDKADSPVTVTCMANGSQGSVWGTGPFTADSSICTAALYAGVITAHYGGEVTFEFSDGRDSYDSGEANGVTTKSYGAYGDSFDFVD